MSYLFDKEEEIKEFIETHFVKKLELERQNEKKLNEKCFNEILRRMGVLEQRMIDMIHPLQSLRSDNLLERISTLLNQPLKIDDRPVRKAFSDLEQRLDKFEKLIRDAEFKHFEDFMSAIKETNLKEMAGMLQYQANRLKEMEKILEEFKSNPPERQVKVDITLDGKKQTVDLDAVFKANDEKKYILSKLTESEYKVFKEHLKDGVRNSFSGIGKKINLSATTVRNKWLHVVNCCKKDKKLFDILIKQVDQTLQWILKDQVNTRRQARRLIE